MGRRCGGSSGNPTQLCPPWEGEVTVKALVLSLLWKWRAQKAGVTGDSLNRIHPCKPELALSTNHIQFPAPQWLYWAINQLCVQAGWDTWACTVILLSAEKLKPSCQGHQAGESQPSKSLRSLPIKKQNKTCQKYTQDREQVPELQITCTSPFIQLFFSTLEEGMQWTTYSAGMINSPHLCKQPELCPVQCWSTRSSNTAQLTDFCYPGSYLTSGFIHKHFVAIPQSELLCSSRAAFL